MMNAAGVIPSALAVACHAYRFDQLSERARRCRQPYYIRSLAFLLAYLRIQAHQYTCPTACAEPMIQHKQLAFCVLRPHCTLKMMRRRHLYTQLDMQLPVQ
jgi:hypothetical protein